LYTHLRLGLPSGLFSSFLTQFHRESYNERETTTFRYWGKVRM
jgi:hypothetical protein